MRSNARFEPLTCLVSILWLWCPRAYGGSCKTFLEGFQRGCNVVAGVALCDIPTCFITRRKSFCLTGTILNTFEMLSEDDLHFFVASAALSRHFRLVVLRVFANCNVSAASSGDNVQSVWETARGSFRGRRHIW